MQELGQCERRSQVEEEMDRLSTTINGCENALSGLAPCLDSVVLHPPHGGGTEEDAKEQALVPLAARIRDFRKRLSRIDSGMRELRESIEL